MVDYTTVTELPGCKASREQSERLYHRYRFASEFCKDKDVLEVACGGGIGLGYLAKIAKKVIGGDIDENNLKFAREHYKHRPNIELKILDARQLPFENDSFDVVILYEAIYYLIDPEKFISEAKRVLRNGGVLLICTANKDWSGFNPSLYSYKYFSAPELFDLLKTNGFVNITLYGDCPAKDKTIKDKITSYLKRMAVGLHLIPKTMKGKEFLKRIFFGELAPLPFEIYEGMAKYSPPTLIPYDSPNYDYKVLYVVARARQT